MREKMIDECDIRICAGGKIINYKGCMPGILEEVLIAVEKESPFIFSAVLAELPKEYVDIF